MSHVVDMRHSINVPLGQICHRKCVGMSLCRIAFCSIEIVEILGLDHIEPGSIEPLKKRNELRMRDRRAFARIRDKTTTPVVDGEGVGQSTGINLDATICDVEELHAVSIRTFHQFPEL